MIIFDKVRYKNFLSMGNQFQEIELSAYKNTLIVGKNGGGKSSIIDAVVYGLFGKAYRNINKNQLINSINSADCVVEVEFRVGSKRCKVVRGQKPSIFEIWVNDKLTDQSSSIVDYQRHLENNILKMNYNMFTQIVVLGSTSYVPFMQLSPASRREIVESILDIGIFSKMNQVVKEHSQKLKDKIADIEYQISILETKVELKENHIAELSEKNDQIISSEMEYIEGCQKTIETLNSNIETILKDVDTRLKMLPNASKESKTETELVKCENKLDTALDKLIRELKFFQTQSNCPTCDQEIGEEHKSKSIKEKKTKQSEIENALQKLNRQLNLTRDRISDMKVKQLEIAKLQQEVSSLGYQKTSQESNINRSMKKIDGYKVTGDVDHHVQELREIESKCDSVKDHRNVCLEERKYQTLAIQMLKDSGIKSRVIKQYLPKMNALINRYLLVMDFFINFELDDRFNETIRSRNRDSFTYASFSEGEKFRINIALLLTWREIAKMKNSVNTNLLFLDEVFDSSLDSSGIDEFFKLLQELGDSVNVFLISHKTDQLSDKFDLVLRFKNEKQFSEMEVSY